MNPFRRIKVLQQTYHVKKDTAINLYFLEVCSVVLAAIPCGAACLLLIYIDEVILKLDMIGSLPGESEYWLLLILFLIGVGFVSTKFSARWCEPIIEKESGIKDAERLVKEIGDEIPAEILQKYMTNTKDNQALDRLVEKHLKVGKIQKSHALMIMMALGVRDEKGFEEIVNKYR